MELNSILMEGEFLHFTSKKGAVDTCFLIQNKGGSFEIKIGSSFAQNLKKGCKVRVVGRLEKINKRAIIAAEHLDVSY